MLQNNYTIKSDDKIMSLIKYTRVNFDLILICYFLPLVQKKISSSNAVIERNSK
jgi:hypothetical protein